jgi:hypothetical protein
MRQTVSLAISLMVSLSRILINLSLPEVQMLIIYVPSLKVKQLIGHSNQFRSRSTERRNFLKVFAARSPADDGNLDMRQGHLGIPYLEIAPCQLHSNKDSDKDNHLFKIEFES